MSASACFKDMALSQTQVDQAGTAEGEGAANSESSGGATPEGEPHVPTPPSDVEQPDGADGPADTL